MVPFHGDNGTNHRSQITMHLPLSSGDQFIYVGTYVMLHWSLRVRLIKIMNECKGLRHLSVDKQVNSLRLARAFKIYSVVILINLVVSELYNYYWLSLGDFLDRLGPVISSCEMVIFVVARKWFPERARSLVSPAISTSFWTASS